MTSPTKADTTPANVASLATKSLDLADNLDRRSLTLLGIFGQMESLTALVRLPGGRVKRVKVGDRLGTGIVSGIDTDGLMLAQYGQTRRLQLPG